MSAPRIFISHSHFDNVACRRIVQFLRDRLGPGVDIFFDESELHGGDDWFRRIQHEVIARPIFLVVLSRHSVVAEWVAEETNLALTKSVKDKTRKVIPVQIDPDLTLDAVERFAPILTLRQITYLDDAASQANWDDLARVVQGQVAPPAPQVNLSQAKELESARDLVAQVHEAMTQGQYRTAVKLGRTAVELPGNERDATLWGELGVELPGNERDATLWGELGVALVQMGETAEGLTALDTALTLNRTRPDLLRVKAQVLVKQGKYDQALREWDKAFVVTSARTERMVILTEAYTALAAEHQWSLVTTVIDDALDLAPNDATWLLRRTQLQLIPLQEQYDRAVAQKDWVQAVSSAEQALRIVPNDAAWQQWRTQGQVALHNTQQLAVAEAEAKLLPPTLRAKGFTVEEGKALVPPLSAVIPAGPFTMGDAQAYNGGFTGTPKVALTLGAFQIGLYPVTVAEYACAVTAQGVTAPQTSGVTWESQQQHPDHPVVYVSWLQAREYARWLAQVTGQPWRLPSEAEWERAARGTDGRIYPWGNQWDAARANTSEGGPKTTTSVGLHTDKGDASACGAHDLAGNVWEWTKSIWQDQYDAVKCEHDSDITSIHVLRGGSWDDAPWGARAASRFRVRPGSFTGNVGFRLAFGVVAGM